MCLLAEKLPDFQLSDVVASLTREQRSPTVAPGRARYGGTAPRQGKRPRVASPGLSPSGKEPRVEEEEESSSQGEVEDEVSTSKGENSTNENEQSTGDQDKNVTVRKNKQKDQEWFSTYQPSNKISEHAC